MDHMRLHDPFLVTRFAVQKNLASTPGWVWTQDYLGKFPIIKHVFKVSRFMKQVKFGIEIPQSTKRAFETGKIEGNNLWKDSLQIEIDQLHANIRMSHMATRESHIIVFMMQSLMADINADW